MFIAEKTVLYNVNKCGTRHFYEITKKSQKKKNIFKLSHLMKYTCRLGLQNHVG